MGKKNKKSTKSQSNVSDYLIQGLIDLAVAIITAIVVKLLD